MQLILQVIAMISLYVCIALFRYKTERNFEFNLEVPAIRMHKGYLILGVVLSASLCLLATWIYLDGSEVASFVVFIFALLSASLIFAYFGFRITFDDEKIVYRHFFENPKIIYYKEITEIEHGLDLIIKTKEKRLVVPNYMTNTVALTLKMMPYLPKRKKIKEIPKVRRFVDSVERPYEFIVVFWILEIVICGFYIGLFINQGITISTNVPIFVLGCVSMGICSALVFLCVHSAKRAHSSAFWNKVAKKLFKEGYLKD